MVDNSANPLKFLPARGFAKDIIKTVLRDAKIWARMSRNSFLISLSNKSVFLIFLLGKILRFVLFISFLQFLLKGVTSFAGYSADQTIFFFLTYVVIDSTSQFLLREVYRFRQLVVTGDFDLVLLKPYNPLLRVLFGGADFIDLVTLPFVYSIVYVSSRSFSPTAFEVLAYLVLLFNGLIIAIAFHVLVVSFGILTFEIDHTIMIYRDVTNLGRFPLEIYNEPIKTVVTYFIPIGIMITIPAKTFMGLFTGSGILWVCVFGLGVFLISLQVWRFALKKYTSASS